MHQIEQSRIQQVIGLTGVAQQFQPRFGGGIGHGAEIDMRGEIAQARQVKRIVQAVVPVMHAQRAAVALRVEILGARKPVVEAENDAPLQALRQAGDPGRGGEVDLRQIVRPRIDCAGSTPKRPLRQGLVAPCELAGLINHAAFEQLAIQPAHQMDRHRVEHFIGQNQTAKTVRQRIEPDHARQQLRRFRRQQGALSVTQVGTEFKNPVLRRQTFATLQFAQQIERQTTAAGAEFQDVAAGLHQHGFGGTRQRATEQRRHFRRGDEITGRAELGRASGVVAQPRRIEGQFHVAGERNPAACPLDFSLDMGAHLAAMDQRIRVGGRQTRCGWLRRRGWSGHGGCASFGAR